MEHERRRQPLAADKPGGEPRSARGRVRNQEREGKTKEGREIFIFILLQGVLTN